ncbi:hypothetical protein [Chitinibacter sp. S2-10]|uniref:hypothetical protein n=1 Tax=Chitinibacter sp. S2-10 TaxID=3373597 RepID=UPI003977BDDD
MLMVTTDNLPEGCVIQTMYPLVWAYQSVQISEKSILQSVVGAFGKKEPGVQGAFDALASLVPPEANAIVGVKVTTSSQAFGNGTFLYVTVTGTPVTYERREPT